MPVVPSDRKQQASIEEVSITQLNSSLPAIEKFEGTFNYIWKSAMQMCLIHKDLWGCVDGTDGDSRRDKKAMTKIRLMLKPCTYSHVRFASSAKQAWQNVQKTYEDKDQTRLFRPVASHGLN
jgi:hypothetical protein